MAANSLGAKRGGTGRPGAPPRRRTRRAAALLLLAPLAAACALSTAALLAAAPSAPSSANTLRTPLSAGGPAGDAIIDGDSAARTLLRGNGDDGGAARRRRPLRFRPGSLPLTQAQTLRRCYTNATVYARHFRQQGVSLSREHGLAYRLLPKSGSSTGRHVMSEHFHAEESFGTLSEEDAAGLTFVTFVRDPLSRFHSQYEETFVRTAPWFRNENPYWEGREPRVAHPYAFLYEGLSSYHDYEDLFCPPPTRTSRRECVDRPSREDGTLASRFERFVREWDGRDAYNLHLNLQVPMLSSRRTGLPLNLTYIYNTTDSEGGWRDIARRFLGDDAALSRNGGAVIAGRSYPRRFDAGRISAGARRRMCELTLIDYCCLNFPLPDACAGGRRRASGDENDGARKELLCRVNERGRIEPGVFPRGA